MQIKALLLIVILIVPFINSKVTVKKQLTLGIRDYNLQLELQQKLTILISHPI